MPADAWVYYTWSENCQKLSRWYDASNPQALIGHEHERKKEPPAGKSKGRVSEVTSQQPQSPKSRGILLSPRRDGNGPAAPFLKPPQTQQALGQPEASDRNGIR